MKSSTKLMALASVCILIAASGALVLSDINEAEASKTAPTRTVTCGDSANLTKIIPGSEIVSGTIPGVTFSYTIEGGQPFIKSTGTFTKAGTYTIVSDYLSWSITFVVAISTLEIPYVAPNSNATANVNWSYTPTTESGVTVTVSGVDWLSVNGTNLYGVPPATGEYNITIHMSKQGFIDRTETFTLNVVSMLVVLNSPNYGVIVYLV